MVFATVKTVGSYNRVDVETNPKFITDSIFSQLMKTYNAAKEEPGMIFGRIGVTFEIGITPNDTIEGKEIEERLKYFLYDVSAPSTNKEVKDDE